MIRSSARCSKLITPPKTILANTAQAGCSAWLRLKCDDRDSSRPFQYLSMRLQMNIKQVMMETAARHKLSVVRSDVTAVNEGSERISFAKMARKMLVIDMATIDRRRKIIFRSNLEYDA
jgi:hypothetical protein